MSEDIILPDDEDEDEDEGEDKIQAQYLKFAGYYQFLFDALHKFEIIIQKNYAVENPPSLDKKIKKDFKSDINENFPKYIGEKNAVSDSIIFSDVEKWDEWLYGFVYFCKERNPSLRKNIIIHDLHEQIGRVHV